MKLAIGEKKGDYSWIAVFIGYLNDIIDIVKKLFGLFNKEGAAESEAE